MTNEKKFVTIGGGIGSFCFYQTLRIHGIAPEEIAVIALHKKPYHQFKTNCEYIGLEKLRSDSGSRVDNFWGFPGYGVSEALELLKKKKLFDSLKVLLHLFFEPLGLGYYCPKVERVYKAIDKEVKRIGWEESLHLGRATNINKLDDNKYEVVYSDKNNKKHKIYTSNVHLSLGHGSSSYQSSEKILKKVKENGGQVLVIGRGTTAARIVERLLTLKSKKNIEVISLHRNELPDYADNRSLKQKQFFNWRLQQFNWPKSAFGGELMEKILENGSIKYLYQWGLPSVVPDRKWTKLVRKSFHEGKYKIIFSAKDTKADYVIDCSGFNESPKHNKFLSSLIKKYALPLNSLGNIKIGKHFEIEKMCTYTGRVSLTGAVSAGNYYGPVDSFFGHQYATLSIIENTPQVKKLNTIRSFVGWYKWFLNKKI